MNMKELITNIEISENIDSVHGKNYLIFGGIVEENFTLF